MKTKILIAFMFTGLLASSLVGCKKDDDNGTSTVEVSGITLDQDSVELEVGSTAVLVASLLPDGATGEVTWSSSETSVAVVNGGVITAIGEGEALVYAAYGIYSTSCVVKVEAEALDEPSLSGTNYHVIQLGETAYATIEDNVDSDLRPDDATKFLYVWEETYSAGSSGGLNFYGQTETWVSLVVNSVGWSGAGYNISADYGAIDFTDMYDNPGDYYFHIALKSTQTNTSYLFTFADASASANICLGTDSFTDNGVTYESYADFTRDGEWHEIEIPVTKLNDLGIYYNTTFTDVNVLAFLAGGTSGTTLDMDAVFFYKKAAK